MTKGEEKKQTSLSYSTCICVTAKCTNAHTEVAASVYEVTKFREGWVASPTMISPKQIESVHCFFRHLMLHTMTGQSRVVLSIQITYKNDTVMYTVLPLSHWPYWLFLEVALVFYKCISSQMIMYSFQSSASPLQYSDDACAPRNTVAVATCSLTILCFFFFFYRPLLHPILEFR